MKRPSQKFMIKSLSQSLEIDVQIGKGLLLVGFKSFSPKLKSSTKCSMAVLMNPANSAPLCPASHNLELHG